MRNIFSLCLFIAFFFGPLFSREVVAVVRMNEPAEINFEVKEPGGFPSSRLYLGLASVNMKSVKYYERLYGSYSVMPMIGGDKRIFAIGPLAVGWGMRVGYYSDTGKRAKKIKVDNPAPDELELSEEKSVLTLIPLQVLLSAQFSPFASQALVLDFWGGVEEVFFQEMREESSGQATTGGKALINSGGHSSMVVGLGLNVSFNAIFGAPSQSVLFSGVTGQYVSLFMEYTAKPKSSTRFLLRSEASQIDYSRQAFGLSFVFALK